VSVTTERLLPRDTTRSVDNLVCQECGLTYYSAAVATMLARGERCDCGGLLVEVEVDAEAEATAQTSQS
jgi:hypothetical protein